MCRYSMTVYKEIWACFECRKSFKLANRRKLKRSMPIKADGSRLALCPECKRPMHEMGPDFQAPKQREVKQWQKVELLLLKGFRYFSCGCNGPGYRPQRLREVPAFLEAHRQQEALMEKERREVIRGMRVTGFGHKRGYF